MVIGFIAGVLIAEPDSARSGGVSRIVAIGIASAGIVGASALAAARARGALGADRRPDRGHALGGRGQPRDTGSGDHHRRVRPSSPRASTRWSPGSESGRPCASDNTELVDELRASRARIVAASDAGAPPGRARPPRRRPAEPGAAQPEARPAGASARRRIPPQPRALVGEARADLDRALDELRDLAHGIYPQVLTSDGLVGGARRGGGASRRSRDRLGATERDRYSARARGGGLLLLPGGAPERRQARRRRRAASRVTLRQPTASSGSRSPTTAPASTPALRRTAAPGSRTWPTGSARSAAGADRIGAGRGNHGAADRARWRADVDAWLTRLYERHGGRYVTGCIGALFVVVTIVTVMGGAVAGRYVGISIERCSAPDSGTRARPAAGSADSGVMGDKGDAPDADRLGRRSGREVEPRRGSAHRTSLSKRHCANRGLAGVAGYPRECSACSTDPPTAASMKMLAVLAVLGSLFLIIYGLALAYHLLNAAMRPLRS